MTEIFSLRGGRSFSIGVWALIAGLVFLWSGLLHFGFSPSGYNIKRVVQTGWFFLLCIFIFNKNTRERIHQVVVAIPPIVLFLFMVAMTAGVISSFLAEYPYKGIQEVGLYALLFFSVLFVAASDISNKQIVFIVACLGAGVVLYFYGYLFRYAVYIQNPPETWMHTIYQFSNPRSLNHVQNWLMPLFGLLPVLASKHSNFIRGLSWLPLTLMYFFLFLTGGRGLTLALVVTFTGSYYLFRKSILTLLKVQLYSAVVGFLVYFVLIQLIPFSLGYGFDLSAAKRLSSDSSSLHRLELWRLSLEVFGNHPWFGNGPQHFILQTGKGPGSPHNLIFQWLSEWGGIATTAFLGGASFCILKILNGFNKITLLFNVEDENPLIKICLLMGSASAFFHSQVSGVFVTPMSQLVMMLVLGITLGYLKQDKKNKYFEKKWLTNALYGSIFFLGVSYFAIFYWEFLAEQYPVALFMESAAPRFWQNGAFPLHL